MQLKPRGKVSQALAAATCSLLSVNAQAVDSDTSWDMTHLHYAEKGRVSVAEQVVAMEKIYTDEDRFKLKLYHDSITGATPNGGGAFANTFTSASGGSYYSDGSGDALALIQDERIAVSAEWVEQTSRLEKRNYSLSYSNELDYDSVGASLTYDSESKDRMRSYNWGGSINYDVVRAQGGIPTGLAASTDMTRTAQENSVVVDLIAGMTQVLNRKTLLQFNYTLGLSNGYLTDPYKYISVIGGTVPLQYERRPSSRLGHSFYTRAIYNHKKNVAKASYRLYVDDWGVFSHTIDMRYRYKLKGRWHWQPHVRYYSQSAADFYSYAFYREGSDAGFPVSSDASSDYRLGNLTTLTAGVQFGRKVSRNSEFAMRIEHINQSDRLGEFQSVNALVAQISFTYKYQ
ncbi:MAG: DUF3570 domain-containing protein [Gammaproteobacteria bacterium]|nr:DUF3570 domain-containing protein [Gammaproteobacteria bacterium]